MKEIFESILLNIDVFFGSGMILSIFLICLVYLSLTLNKHEKSYMLYPFIVCLFLIAFNPLVYLFFVQFVEAFSYNRVFWLLLIPIFFAFCIVKLLDSVKVKSTKCIITVVLTLAILFLGVDESLIISKAENTMKIPTEATQIATILSENVVDDDHRSAVHYDLFLYIRQYDASINLTYSRRLYQIGHVEYETSEYTEACFIIDDMIFSHELPYDANILKAAFEETKTSYLVLPILSHHTEPLLTESWIKELNRTNSYIVLEIIN